MTEPILFTSLGQTILDDIKHPSFGILPNVLGGSGTYATLGARMVLGSGRGNSIAWLLRVGADFPDSLLKAIQSWSITLDVDRSEARGTFRGLLEYHDASFDSKTFHYTNQPTPLSPASLPASMLRSKCFHVGPPAVFSTQIQELLVARQGAGIQHRPFVVWEPSPSLCRSRGLVDAATQASYADVFSPNHVELAQLGAVDDLSEAHLTSDLLERLAARFLDAVAKPHLIIVIRVAERGCFYMTKGQAPQWIPAFHTNGERVVDTTGGGNAFLGGFAAAYMLRNDVRQACISGTVAASFVIEQIGLPTRDGEEWNSQVFQARRDAFELRLSDIQ